MYQQDSKDTNKFLRIILNHKPYDSPIRKLHAISNIQTIHDYIKNSRETAHHPEHQNPLISQKKITMSTSH